jgi:hypothetical protein
MDDAPKLRLLSASDFTVIGGRILPPDAPEDDAQTLEESECEVIPNMLAFRRRRTAQVPPPPPPQAA